MPEATGARTVLNIKNDVVGLVSSHSHGNSIHCDRVADFPGDDVVRAGGVSTHAQAADKFSLRRIESQPSGKNDHPANRFANQWVICLTKVFGLTGVSGLGVGAQR